MQFNFFSLFFSPFRECSLFSECGRFVILGSACYLPDEPHPPMVYIPKINFTSFFQNIFLHFDFTSFFLLYYIPSMKYIVTMKVWLPIQEILWKITPFIVLISKLVSIVIVSSSRMTKSFWAIIKVSTCTKMFWQSCQSNIKPFTCTSSTLIWVDSVPLCL